MQWIEAKMKSNLGQASSIIHHGAFASLLKCKMAFKLVVGLIKAWDCATGVLHQSGCGKNSKRMEN
jgi:hypothetical protein